MRPLMIALALALTAPLAACGGDDGPSCTQVPLGDYDVTYTKKSAECDGWKDALTVPLALAADDEFAACGDHKQIVKESFGLDCTITTKESVTSTDIGFSGTATSTLKCGSLGQALGGMPEKCVAVYDMIGTPKQ